MYKSTVTEIGSLALSFAEEKVVILFGPQAPLELKEVSVVHEVIEEIASESIKEGSKLFVDNQEYTITAIGTSANDNLKELGHISIYFTEPSEDVLPGAVFAEPHQFPEFKEGSIIEFK